MKRIEMVFEHTDPEGLLKDDQHLLNDFSPATLAGASSEDRILWEEEMRAAKSAAFFDDVSRTLEEMDVDEEESRMSVDSAAMPEGSGTTINHLE